jgi:hypothetical protein
VSDAQLLGMLEKVNEGMPKTGITVRRAGTACWSFCDIVLALTRLASVAD